MMRARSRPSQIRAAESVFGPPRSTMSLSMIGSKPGRGGKAPGECRRAFRAQDPRWVDALGEREALRVGSQRCEPPDARWAAGAG